MTDEARDKRLDDLLAENRLRLLAARADLLAEVGAYPSEQVAGSAQALRQAKVIFGVRHGGAWLYPAFQFDLGGTPRAEIAEVLAALGEKATSWDVLLWFTEPNEHLQGRSPLQVWPDDRHQIVAAVRDARWVARD